MQNLLILRKERLVHVNNVGGFRKFLKFLGNAEIGGFTMGNRCVIVVTDNLLKGSYQAIQALLLCCCLFY
jgi:N-acetyl-gamma-glutamylphosphate reductase